MQTRHFIASTTLLLMLVASLSGQNSGAVAEWRILNVPELGLSLNFPADFAFALNMYERDPGRDQKKSRGEFQSDSERFYIFVDSEDRNEQFRIVTKFITENIDQDKKKAFFKNETGRVEFADKDGYYHRVRFFKTKSKMITLQTVSTDKESKLAERLLNSISFSDDVPTPATEEVSNRERMESGSSGRDFGQFGATARNDGKRNAVTSPKPANAPLRLISKPRAQYTDFALFYNIQGIVRVRVAFDADGKIGAVNVLKKLPFGLLDESIKAARKMKFKPKEQDGKPVTTLRAVEYSFTIY